METTRPIVDADEEELADEDTDLEGEEEEIIHAKVKSIVIHMETAHTPAVRVRHLGQNTRRKQTLQI